MKKLAILSSLALLVAPSFKGNAFTDLARNQIKMIDEAGDSTGYTYVEKTGTVYFGENKTSSGTQFTADNYTDYYKADGFVKADGSTQNVKFTKFDYCLSGGVRNNTKAESENYSLRFGSSDNTADLVLNFNGGIILSSVSVFAKAYSSSQSGGSFEFILDGTTKGNSNSITSDSTWEECKFENLNDDSYSTFSSVEFKKATVGSKNELFSKIVFNYYVKVPTTVTVTYDYGIYTNDDWDKSDIATRGEKLTPFLSEGYSFTDWMGTHTLLGWTTGDGDDFDFTTTTIDEDITVHAVWIDDETDELKNIKDESKTKSQLYYEYDIVSLQTKTLDFGTGLTENNFTNNFEEYEDDGDVFAISSISATNCGYNDDCALRLGSNKQKGSFTLNFEKVLVKEVNIYAQMYDSQSKGMEYKLSSSANTTGSTITIKEAKSTTFGKYTVSNLDGGTETESTYIKFEAVNSRSQRISISKIEIVMSGTGTGGNIYCVSNMGLRFGGQIAKDHYEAATQNEEGKTVKDHVASVGMIWTTTLPEKTDGNAYDNLTDAIKAGAVTAENAHVKSQDVASKELVLDGDYYRYNCNIGVSEASIATIVYAVATMTFDNGLTIYLEEASYSVVTIAKAYVADEATYATYSEPIQKTLKALSEGKTSVAIA